MNRAPTGQRGKKQTQYNGEMRKTDAHRLHRGFAPARTLEVVSTRLTTAHLPSKSLEDHATDAASVDPFLFS